METTFFLKSLSLFHCVPLYVCRLCINFQDLCARLLGMAALYFHFTLRTFVAVETVLRRGRMFQGSDEV